MSLNSNISSQFNFTPVEGANYSYDYAKIISDVNRLVDSEPRRFIHLMRTFCQDDLFFLLYFILKVPVNHPWLVDRITEVQDCNDRTLDLWAREHFKSTIITYGLNIQEILRDPETRIGIFSHTKSIAKSFLFRIKSTFESNDILKALFPDILYTNPEYDSPRWSLDDGICVRRNSVFQEMTVEAWGLVDGMPTSKHFPILNYDDIVTKESISTPDQIKKVDDSLRLSFNLGTQDGKKRVIGTIYHWNDTHVKLMNQIDSNGKNMWTVRKHPCIDETGKPVILTEQQLEEKKVDQGPYVYSCLPENTLILLEDFKLKEIQNIKVGEYVVGFAKGGQQKRGGLVPTQVVATRQSESEVYRFHLSNGDYVDCTSDHKWWVGRWRGEDSGGESDSNGRTYLPLGVDKNSKGTTSAVVKILDIPWGELSTKEWEAASWLGGIFDGEGSISNGLLTIAQSRRVHPEVCDRIEQYLKLLKFDFGIHERVDQIENLLYYLRGGRNEVFRFLLLTNPAKRKQIVDGLLYRGGRVGGKAVAGEVNRLGRVEVIRQEHLGKMSVFNIQTNTGNYIANGYASSNCQMLLNPVADALQEFKPEWIKYWRTLPEPLNKYGICDPASSKKKGSDYTVIGIIGLDALGNYYLVDMIRKRLNLRERWLAIKEMMQIHPDTKKFGYEKYAMQSDQEYFEEMMRREGFNFTIEPLGGIVNKKERIRRLQPRFAAGRYYLPYSLQVDGEDLTKVFLEEEYLLFPYCPHDDMLDMNSRIFDDSFEAVKPISFPIQEKSERYSHKPKRSGSWMSA